jgi:putative endonuclease
MRNSLLLPVELDTIFRMAGRKRATKKMEPRWFLYILKCKDNTFYTGITTDLERRLTQHNDGSASRYTRSRKPVKMVYNENCDGHSAALKRECEVKKLTREEKKRLVKQKR